MKTFHCDHCGHLLFFENTTCVQCGRQVAYLPDTALVKSLDPAGDGTWRSSMPELRSYRLCRNYTEEQICNWAIAAADTHPLCASCRLTKAIPDLSVNGHRQAWYRLEVAKRRLLFTLLQLSLPVCDLSEDPRRGLTFEFKASAPGDESVLTGYSKGVITINIAETDDVERERQRTALHEPYRTILGHVRHEIGHYYWHRLISESPEIEAFRELFGDERQDYGAALRANYEQGPASNWPERFVSAYAGAHPWEDWAETWAHYLHMVDALETAAACGLSLRPQRTDEPSMARVSSPLLPGDFPFRSLIENWFPLTYVLNNFNRGLGLADAYPFVLSSIAVSKLQYVHEVIRRSVEGGVGPA
jgi:hypothetical protein